MPPRLAYACLYLLTPACLLWLACAHQRPGRSSGVYDGAGGVVAARLGSAQKRALEQEILALLSLHHRPRTSGTAGNSSAPQFMLDLYERMLQREEGEEREVSFVQAQPWEGPHQHLVIVGDKGRTEELMAGSADIIMSFNHHSHHHDSHHHIRHGRHRLFRFSLDEVPLGSRLLTAELRVYKLAANLVDLPPGDTLRIRAYQVTSSAREPVFQDEVWVSADSEGWMLFNVSHALAGYDALMTGEVLLYVDVVCNRTGKVLKASEVSVVNSGGGVDKQAFMVGFYRTDHTNTLIRRKRSPRRRDRSYSGARRKHFAHGTVVESHRDRRKRRSCQKRYMHVNFKDLGWEDWIIAPDGYSAFYCDGECSFPLNAHMNATNHAIVQTLVHLMDSHLAPKACCAPKKLTSISVLYYNDNSNVVLKKYRNMVVRSCGCH